MLAEQFVGRVVEMVPAAKCMGRGLFPVWPSLQQFGMESRVGGEGWVGRKATEGDMKLQTAAGVTNQPHCCPVQMETSSFSCSVSPAVSCI